MLLGTKYGKYKTGRYVVNDVLKISGVDFVYLRRVVMEMLPR
jgi:hypothetical protein